MLRRAFLAVLLTGLSLAGPGVASGQEPIEVTDGDDDGTVCVGDGFDGSCGDPLARDDRAAVLYRVDEGGTLVGIVPAAAATVQVLLDGRTLTVPAVPPPAYSGSFAGRIKVFRAVLPEDVADPLGEPAVRVLDASGALVGVLPGFSDRRRGARQRLFRLTVRGEVFTLARETRAELRPTLLDLGREDVFTCLTLVRGQSCFGDVLPRTLLDVTATCRTRVIYGIVPAGTTASIVLGDGRRVRARTARFDDERSVFVAPSAVTWAIRRVELTRDGRTRRFALGFAPVLGCAQLDGFFLGLGDEEPGPAPVIAERGVLLEDRGHRLRAGDLDGELCLGIDGEPFRACGDLERGPGAVVATARRLPDGAHVVAGLVHAAVPQVQVRAGTIARRVPTVEVSAAAAGPYAGRVRGFAVVLAPGRRPGTVSALTAAGRPVDPEGSARPRVPEEETSEPIGGVRRVARLAGARTLWRLSTDGAVCLAITGGRRPRTDDVLVCGGGGREAPAVAAFEAPCATRRLSVVAVLRGRAARLSLRTGAGRLLRSRSTAIGDGWYAHRLAPPASSAVRSITVTSSSGERVRQKALLPPARSQCGYAGSVVVDGSPDAKNGLVY